MDDFRPHPFSLRQLQYIVAVAELRSFRRAAAACNVSQPSLSAQIAQVERTLGVQLFERDRGGVLLTSDGNVFVERARALLRDADDIVYAARQFTEPFSRSLTLGVIPTIAPYLLPEAMLRLRAQYPKLKIFWLEEKTPSLVERLNAGKIDGAILALEAEIGTVAHYTLGRDEFVLALPKGHALARRKDPIRLDEIEGEPLLLLEDGHCFRDQVLTACESANVEEADFRATSLSTLVQITAGGAGITLLPRLALSVENRAGSLVIREIGPRPPFRTIALVWRPRSALATTLSTLGETLRGALHAERTHANKALGSRSHASRDLQS